MDFLLLRQALVLLASAISAYTDWKTGLVFDKITYPLIAIGIILNLLEQQWLGLLLGAIVFAGGYVFYYAGKIGGGDVKLFAGIALALPFFGKAQGIFLLNVLFFSAMLAIIVFTIYFAGRYLLKRGISFKENKKGIITAASFGFFLLLYLWLVLQLKVLSAFSLATLTVPLAFGLVFLALEKGIRKEFFLKKVLLKDLEEDELLATEFENKKTLEVLDLQFKGVLGEKEIEKLKKAKISEVLVYRNAPRFAPFIFLGSVFAMMFPDLVGLFFLRL